MCDAIFIFVHVFMSIDIAPKFLVHYIELFHVLFIYFVHCIVRVSLRVSVLVGLKLGGNNLGGSQREIKNFLVGLKDFCIIHKIFEVFKVFKGFLVFLNKGFRGGIKYIDRCGRCIRAILHFLTLNFLIFVFLLLALIVVLLLLYFSVGPSVQRKGPFHSYLHYLKGRFETTAHIKVLNKCLLSTTIVYNSPIASAESAI